MGKIASHLGVQNRTLWSAGSLPSMILLTTIISDNQSTESTAGRAYMQIYNGL